MKLSDCLDWYWPSKIGLSPHTKRDYGLTFRRLLAFLGPDAEMQKITHRDLQRFLAHLETEHKLGKKTVLNAWAALASLWRWANTDLEIPNVVAGQVKMPKYNRPPVHPLTPEEIDKLLDACDTYMGYDPHNRKSVIAHLPQLVVLRNKAIIVTLYDSGLRREELVSLLLRDYDAKTGRITVRHGKGDKPRMVHVGNTTRRAILQYMVRRGTTKPDDALFASSADGKTMLGSSIYRMIQRLGKRAGVQDAGVHRFRHSFATDMIRNGASERAVQDLLGHESPEMTRRYAEFVEADVEREHELASPVDARYKRSRLGKPATK